MKKKNLIVLLTIGMTVGVTGCSGVTQEEYNELQNNMSVMEQKKEDEIALLTSENTNLQGKYDELNDKYNALQAEYEDYKNEMKPYEELSEAEAKQKKAEAEAAVKEQENQQIAKEAVDKIWDFTNGTLQEGATRDLYNEALEKVNVLTDENQKAALMEAINAVDASLTAQEQAAAAEEAAGYETGITYDQLARTPDDFIGKKVKFYGKVLQVIEGDDEVQLRLAVNDNYDTVLYLSYDKSIVSSRVLEDDYITIYGTSIGTITYQSTMGGNITIPAAMVDKIDQ